jgi:hypothetical protein
MSQLDKVVYLQPPVEFDVKREWNKKGYRVDELQNMPDGFENPSEPEAEKPKGKK